MVHSPTTMEYYVGIRKTFTVLPFKATQQCVASTPAFTYTAVNYVTGVSPNYLSVDPLSGLITVDIGILGQ